MSNTDPSTLDNILSGKAGNPITVLAAGVAVPPALVNLNFAGSCTVSYNPTTGFHIVNVLSGSVGTGIAHSVYGSDGTVPAWTNSPTVDVLTVGSSAAPSGDIRLYNGSQINFANVDGASLVGLSVDGADVFTVAQIAFPSVPSSGQAGQYVGVTGSGTWGYLSPPTQQWAGPSSSWFVPRFIEPGTDLSFSVDDLDGIIVLNYSPVPTTVTVVTGPIYQRVFRYEKQGTYQLTSTTSENMFSVDELVYHGDGGIAEGTSADVLATVELELQEWIYNDGLAALAHIPIKGTFAISWTKNHPIGGGTGSWSLVDGGTENTAMHFGPSWSPMSISITASLSGSTHGNVTVAINHAGATWTTGSSWQTVKWRIKFFGGGSYIDP